MDALSQQDVDSLLRGTAASTSGTTEEVLAYNFLRPARISRERQATLEAIHARFAVSVQSLLTSRLRHPVDVAVTSVEQATFAEFTMALSAPCAAYVYDLGEHAGAQAVLDLDSSLAAHMVDRLFGGNGDAVGERRAITALEQNVLGHLTTRAIGLFAEAWADWLKLEPTPVAFESVPEALQIAAREDNVLVVNLEVRSGKVSGLVTICIPFVAFESFLQEKAGPLLHVMRVRPEDRAEIRSAVEAQLRSVRLPVAARLPGFALTARHAASLREGQVLPTLLPLDTEVELLINERCLFTGTLGRSQGFVGVRVSRDATAERASSETVHWRITG